MDGRGWEEEWMGGGPMQGAHSPQGEPVKPPWKNMLVIAVIAKRPFAISAANLVTRARSRAWSSLYCPQQKNRRVRRPP